MFKKYKQLANALNINYKKDSSLVFLISGSLLICGIILLIVTSSIVGLFCILLSFSYYYSHMSSLKSQLSQLIDAKQIAFNSFYRYVVTLLENKNILYQALKNTLEYCDEVLIPDVENLIMEIENDTSLQPFINFSNIFKDETIKQMVILLYQTQEADSIEVVLNRINECLISMQDTSIESYIKKEEKKVEKFSMVPIILCAVVMIMVSFYILTMIGDGVYV